MKFTYGKAGTYTKSAHYTSPTTVLNLRMPEAVDTFQQTNWAYGFSNPDGDLRCNAPFCALPQEPGTGSPQDMPEIPEPRYYYTDDNAAFNLARAQSNGENVTTLLLDVNADGRVDMLRRPALTAMAQQTPSTGGCKVDVYLNKGSAGFVKNDPAFPEFSLRDAMGDIPVPTSVGPTGTGELLCNLNRSFSPAMKGWYGTRGISDYEPEGDGSEACSDHWEAGPDWKSMQKAEHAFFDVDGDNRPDLVTQVVASAVCPYESTRGVTFNDENWTNEASHIVRYEWGDTESNPCRCARVFDTFRQNYWWVYRNTGSGFSSTPHQVPVPHKNGIYDDDRRLWNLETTAVLPQPGVSSGYAFHDTVRRDGVTGITGESRMLTDFNGDGFHDWVARIGVHDERASVFWGKKNGFENEPYDMSESTDQILTGRAVTKEGSDPDRYLSYHATGLSTDINADGLPDTVSFTEDTGASHVRFNQGPRFGDDNNGGRARFSSTPVTAAYGQADEKDWHEYPIDSVRYYKHRMVDLDGDDLPDQLHVNSQGVSQLHLNGGTTVVADAGVDASIALALAGSMHSPGERVRSDGDRSDYQQLTSNIAEDINGDGLLDLLEDSDRDGIPTVRYARAILDSSADRAAPARLLRTVDNGVGGKTTVSYGRYPIAKKWMVSQISSDPGHGEPVVATKYSYHKAMYKPGPYGKVSFRGAAEVRAQQVGDPSNAADDATTITNYSYTEDPRGVPVRTATVLGGLDFQLTGSDEGSDLEPAAAQAGVMSLTKSRYHTRDLGVRIPGSVEEFKSWVALPEEVTSYTCTGTTGQTLQACEDTAPKTVQSTTWSRYDQPVSDSYVMDLPAREEMQFTNADGQTEIRRSVREHFVSAGPGVYNVAPKKMTDSVVVNGSETPLGETRYSYHDIFFRQVRNVTVDDAAAGVGDRVSRFEYYDSGVEAGQVWRSWEPEQVARYGNSAAAAGYTEVEYDAHGVAVDRTVGPIRYNGSLVTHETRQVTDLATGAVLESQGPNYACADADGSGSLDAAESCTFDAAAAAKLTEFTRNKVDGLGRVLSTRVYAIGDTARAEDGGTEMARATYNDDASYNSGGTQPVNSVLESVAGDGDFTRTVTKLDGMGRALQQSVRIKDTGLDRVTVYRCDDAGRVKDVEVPRADGADGIIRMRTSYDALGRVISNADASPGGRVFDEHSYDGLTHTVRQGATSDSSPESVVRTTTDAAGQLVKVEERTGGTRTSPTFAATQYRYDGAGRTKSMTDADGVLTTMSHDYVGNRTSVTSSGKTWSYTFDGNSQMTAITEPVPVGKSADAFTHHMAYDDAGRLVKERPAVRDLTADQLALLRIGEKTYTYDKAHSSLSRLSGKANFQVGQLSYTTAKDSTTPTPKVAAEVINRYNADGHLAATSQDLPLLNGLVPDAGGRLQVENTVDPAGISEAVEYRAFNSSGVETFDGAKISYEYDRDGTPFQASFDLGGKNMTIRHQRNVAGVVTQRQTNTAATAGFGSPKIDYGYDKYGRVTSLTAAVGSTQRYKQTLGYYDNGEIGNITEQLGDTTAPTTTSTYTYDYRRQLTSAQQSVNKTPGPGQITAFVGYNASFTHTAGGRLATGNVTAAQPTKRLTGRNVSYVYNTSNPQQLDELRKNGDGTALSTYTYDDAGNTTTRTVNGTTTTQTWDGGRLRIAEKQNGEKEVYYYDGANRIATARYNTAGTLTEVIRTFGDLEAVHPAGQNTQHRQQIALGGDLLGRIDGNDQTGTFEHYLTSPQGHQVLALTNDTNTNTIRTATYGPFGEALTEHTPTGTPAGKYRKEFNGKDHDPTSGLHYYGHRHYDPLTLQWTSADPLYRYGPDTSSPRSANLYTYTANNPISHVDPNGLDPTVDLFATVLEYSGIPRDAQPAAMAEAHQQVGQLMLESPIFGLPIFGSAYQGAKSGNWDSLKTEVLVLAVGMMIPGQADDQALRVIAKTDDVARGTTRGSSVEDAGALRAQSPSATGRTAGISNNLRANAVRDAPCENDCIAASVAGAFTKAGIPTKTSAIIGDLPPLSEYAKLDELFGRGATSYGINHLKWSLRGKKAGSTGVVAVNIPGYSKGHAFTYEITPNGPEFYDFQADTPVLLEQYHGLEFTTWDVWIAW